MHPFCKVPTFMCYTYMAVGIAHQMIERLPEMTSEKLGAQLALELVADKWTILLIHTLKNGSRRITFPEEVVTRKAL